MADNWVPNEATQVAVKTLEAAAQHPEPYQAYDSETGDFICGADTSEGLEKLYRAEGYFTDGSTKKYPIIHHRRQH